MHRSVVIAGILALAPLGAIAQEQRFAFPRHPPARDLGVPAARACAQNGEAAVAWLASIPARFRPSELAMDPAFASLQSRPDFRALFPPR